MRKSSILVFQQPGNGPIRRPAQGSPEARFLKMQRDTIVRMLSYLQCCKTTEGTPMRSKNAFSKLETSKI